MTLLVVVAIALLAPVVAVRLVFLVTGRLGWIFYLANTFSESFVKKVGWSRTVVEVGMAIAGVSLLAISGAGWAWVSGVVVFLLGNRALREQVRAAVAGYELLAN